MKRRLGKVLVVILIMVSGGALLLDQLLLDEYDVLKYNWKIDVPKANKVTDLIAHEPSFNGDGETMTLFEYSKPIDLNNTFLTILTSSKITHANRKIEHFKEIATAVNQDSAEIQDIFTQYDVEATSGDYFYYDEKNDGYDFIILLYKTELQQLFLYEWHQ